MPLQLTISGLESDRYLFNNPVWVDITDMGLTSKFLNVKVERTDNNRKILTRMFIVQQGPATVVSIDVSEYVKGMSDYPSLPDGLLDGNEIATNYHEFNLLFEGFDQDGLLVSTGQVTKTFIRGGLENQKTNQSLPDNTLLKESVLVPMWAGQEFRAFRIVNNKIVILFTLPSTDTELLPTVGCNSIYLRFVNMLGGYSYWLFENWEVRKTTEKTDVIDRRGRDISTGHETSYELTVGSRVDRRHFKIIRALIQSPEVYALGLSDRINAISGFLPVLGDWEQIWNGGNSSSIDELQKLEDVSLRFEYILKNTPETVW